MKAEGKTKEELISELVGLRRRVVVLEAAACKQAEEMLPQSENKYRTLHEHLPQKMFHKDRHSVYVSCNENEVRDLKIKPEEIWGNTDYEVFPKELAEKDRRKESIKTLKDRYRLGNIVGKSPAMRQVYEFTLMASSCDDPVVICGETGTGKEIIARAIHEMSARHDQAFVPVNCGAIPEALFEREFFGHRKGAFTGAHMDAQGFFESVSGGTLFLDEVGELSPKMQVKLLRAIEDGEYIPVGDTKARKADVRIVAATHENLSDMVEKGSIRQDFFYRIHIIPITVPPLRDRREDILPLIDHFMNLYGKGQGWQAIPEKILDILYNYDWPGNVRELENVLKRYLTVKRLDFVTPTLQSVHIGKGSGEGFDHRGKGLRDAMEAFEKELILKALGQNRWHRAKTAAMLGIPERTLYRKMKRVLPEMA